MNFEKFFNTQERVRQIIDNSINNNRLVQVLLLEGAIGTPKMLAATYIVSRLLCKDKVACGKCYECSRIEKGIHPRVYLVDSIDGTIKKEQIELLEHEFSESGLEEGTRVFIINNIDKATSSASNSLLKFLEELRDDTYGILITDNINGVISTIKSRSQIISFAKVPINEIIDEYKKHGVDIETANVLSRITNDTEEGLKYIEEDKILDIIELGKKITNSFFNEENPVVAMNKYGKFLLELKDKKYHHIFMDVLTLITNDRLYYLLGKMDEVIFKNDLDSIQNIYDIDYQTTFKQVEKILEYKGRLQYNVNMELFYMGLFIEMVKNI